MNTTAQQMAWAAAHEIANEVRNSVLYRNTEWHAPCMCEEDNWPTIVHEAMDWCLDFVTGYEPGQVLVQLTNCDGVCLEADATNSADVYEAAIRLIEAA